MRGHVHCGTPAVLAAALLAAASGCSLGPRAIEQTHGQYATAVLHVEEEQFLKNIVRLRYLEMPRNLDVAAIAAQYELTAGVEARPFFNSQAARVAVPSIYKTFTSILPFASLGGANRPTVTLDPTEDASTVRQFLTPISVETLLFFSQSGWPVSSILRIWADRLNGVPNWMPASGPPRDLPPDFQRFVRLVELIQSIQYRELASVRADDRATELSGPIPASAVTAAAVVEAAKEGFEYRPRDDGKTWALIKRERRLVIDVHPAGRASPELAELAALANLKPGL
ncbi:MAG TPA: hypothetical protein VLM40_03280, partial [Gemmata sp.]|nr:hypothetical protein [Gemmata sp.]